MKSASADAQSLGKTVRRDGLSLLYVFVETRAGHRVSRGEFRGLRAATQGSALRTCSLSRKAGESFISPAGGIPLHKSYPQSSCAHCGRSCFSTTILHYISTYYILILHFVFYFSAIYPQLSQVCTELSTDVHKSFRRNIHVFCWHLRHRGHRCRSRGH